MSFKSGGSKILVTQYYATLHYNFSLGPVDKIVGLRIGDKDVPFPDDEEENPVTEYSENEIVPLDLENLFGGPKSGGGVKGVMHVMLGRPDQVVDLHLAERFGRTPTTMTGYRGRFTLFFTGFLDYPAVGFYWGATPVLPAVHARPTRMPVVPGVLDTSFNATDANFAYILYELLTSPQFGLGNDPSTVYLPSFQEAAAILFAEGYGGSFKWTRSTPVEQVIQDMKNHIAGDMFFDPVIGLWRLKLFRDDYELSETRVIDGNSARLISYTNPGWADTINDIAVSWTNPLNEQGETVRAQNDANIAIQGGKRVSDNKNFYAFRTQEMALQAAVRELESISVPLQKAELDCDRRHWDLNPGDVVRVNFPQDDIFMKAFRVVKINRGNARSDRIVLNLAEDVFKSAFYQLPSQGSEWVDPASPPEELTLVILEPAPYFMVVGALGETAALEIDYPTAFMSVIVPGAGPDTRRVDYMTEETDANGNTSFVERGSFDVQGRAELVSGIVPEASTTVTLKNHLDRRPLVGHFLHIQDMGTPALMEIAVVTNVVGNDVTLKRGVLDTIPHTWAADTIVAVISPTTRLLDRAERAVGVSPVYKFLPITSLGRLPIDDADEVTEAITDRMYRPLRPADIKIEGDGAETVTVASDNNAVDVTWARRNRLTETQVVLAWDEPDVTPEAGQTTVVKVYDEANSLITTKSALAGVSVTLTNAECGNPAYDSERRIEVYSVRDSFESLQKINRTINFRGENLLAYSHAFSTQYGAAANYTAGAADGPISGVAGATKIRSLASPTTLHQAVRVMSVASVNGQTYCFQCVAKAADLSAFRLQATGTGLSTRTGTYDLGAGTFSVAGTVVASGMDSLGSGWYNCWFAFTSNVTSTLSIRIRLGSADFTGDTVLGIYADHAQVERGSAPSGFFIRKP